VRLAAEEINRSGGLLGYRVVVRPLDDESDSDVAVERVGEIESAIDSGEQVIGVIGHLNSGQTLAAMELYQGMPVTVLSATASEQSLTERGYDNFFRVNANDLVQAQVVAAFLTEDLKAGQIAILHNNTEYGRGLAQSLVAQLKSAGAEPVLVREVEEGQANYDSEVVAVKAAGPDAIFYAGYEIEAPYLRAALIDGGVTAPMVASDGAFLAATIDEANGRAEGMYVTAFAPKPQLCSQRRVDRGLSGGGISQP
jgi:branched-chain amino acid transport system substrate-binding protein